MPTILIADSGSTKTEWVLVKSKSRKYIDTQGLSPYFLNTAQIVDILTAEMMPKLKKEKIDAIYFYGTGCSNPENVKIVQKALAQLFGKCLIKVDHDLMGAAKALCQHGKGIACILGTGSNSCFYNGKKITKNSPGLGYVLGDEGSGAYLGKKVLQYYIYNTFDEDLMERFKSKFGVETLEILNNVYKKPLANRYLASFAIFLVENRGHYMIENIIEDSFNDFFFTHVYKYKESWTMPINFVGSVAYGFRDVLKDMCKTYELQLGTVIKKPLDGLIKYHTK